METGSSENLHFDMIAGMLNAYEIGKNSENECLALYPCSEIQKKVRHHLSLRLPSRIPTLHY
jgi:hypothetical protein